MKQIRLFYRANSMLSTRGLCFLALLSISFAVSDFVVPKHITTEGAKTCWMCEATVGAALKAVSLGGDFMGTLHYICNIVPSAERTKCEQLALVVSKYGKDLPYLIAREGYDAKTVCTMFSICKQSCCTQNQPEQVHLALAGDGTNSMVAMWVTMNPDTSIVKWGVSLDLLDVNVLGNSTTYTSGGWSGRIHRAVMTNLKPNTKYYYQVGGAAAGFSEVYSFYTTPSRDVYRFAVIGDMGVDPEAEPTINSLTGIVNSSSIDVLIHNGDISYADGFQHRWDAYFRRMQTVLGNIPYMVCPGNHEINFVNMIGLFGYRYRFSMPGVESGSNSNNYYSWNYGPVHFIALNSESTEDLPAVGNDQIKWLRADLKSVNRQERPWVVVYLHRPLYCSNDDIACKGQAQQLRDALEDVFYNGTVDLVIQAHKHAYERTAPVYKNQMKKGAPVYIVNGVGGNREGTIGFPPVTPDWSLRRVVDWGYALLDASSSKLSIRFLTSSDNLVKDTQHTQDFNIMAALFKIGVGVNFLLTAYLVGRIEQIHQNQEKTFEKVNEGVDRINESLMRIDLRQNETTGYFEKVSQRVEKLESLEKKEKKNVFDQIMKSYRVKARMHTASAGSRQSDPAFFTYPRFLLTLCIFVQFISCFFTEYSADASEGNDVWEPLHYLLYGKGIQSWEWSREYSLKSPLLPLILSIVGKIFQTLGIPKFGTFYLIRFTLGVFGSYALYFFHGAVRKKFGEIVGITTLLLVLFNHTVILYLNRLSLDAFIAILNLFVFSFWMNDQIFLLIFLSTFTAFLRLNYLPIFAIIMMHLIFTFEEKKTPIKIVMMLYAIASIIVMTGLFSAVDTAWYGKFTFTPLNSFLHNILSVSDHLGVRRPDSPFIYIEALIRENNILIFIGGILGVTVTVRQHIYAFPYGVTFFYLQMLTKRQERYMYFLYPILCLYTSIFFFWIAQASFYTPPPVAVDKEDVELVTDGLPPINIDPSKMSTHSHDSTIGKKVKLTRRHGGLVKAITATKNTHYTMENGEIVYREQRFIFPWRAYVIISILLLYSSSGISSMCHRVYRHSTYYSFFHHNVRPTMRDNMNCMSTTPWSSWLLPAECETLYTINIQDEIFQGYNRIAFRRFEDNQKTALVPLEIPNRILLMPATKSVLNDTQKCAKLGSLAPKLSFDNTPLHQAPVDYIFIFGGEGIDKRAADIFLSCTNKPLRNPTMSKNTFYHELVLGKYLTSHYRLLAEVQAGENFYERSMVDRVIGRWMFEYETEEDNRVTTLTAWKRRRRE
ncbi:putative purple acid phosphatase 20-like [Planoprotostelium fungivorum]|uniref:Purple acid phosphatase n=1 Tax=Planoprotostelium fungivorum TaxID=1890364 RepID=A0A2P6NUS3_9EUKA|nr:putative purple acid phosphatase 20-like [Planoprotostelium fungivorum]